MKTNTSPPLEIPSGSDVASALKVTASHGPTVNVDGNQLKLVAIDRCIGLIHMIHPMLTEHSHTSPLDVTLIPDDRSILKSQSTISAYRGPHKY